MAMYLAGETYWRLYVTEKAEARGRPTRTKWPPTAARPNSASAPRWKSSGSNSSRASRCRGTCSKRELLLAEMHNEAGEAKEAAALYQPLVDAVKAEKPQTFDTNTIRIFLGAVRAYCALKRLDKAGQASDVLVAIGSRHAAGQRSAGRVRQAVEPGAQEGRRPGDGAGESASRPTN